MADRVRQWLNLRYALIPYLVQQGEKAIRTGFPLMRALLMHYPDDPYCWHIDDQFFCGDNLLVAPVLNETGVRDIYLPAGKWVDLWTGEQVMGPVQIKQVRLPVERIPVYAVWGSSIPVYPKAAQCTDRMDLKQTAEIVFDREYKGLNNSILGLFVRL